MLSDTLRVALIAVATTSFAVAQLTVTTTVAGNGIVQNGTVLAPPGMPLTGGFTSANVILADSLSPELHFATLSAATLGAFSAGRAEATIDYRFTSAAPMRTDVTLQFDSITLDDGSGCGTVQASCRAELIGVGFQDSTCAPGCRTTFRNVVIDSSGATVRLFVQASAVPSGAFCRTSSSIRCSSILTPSDCSQRYGTSCGTSWTATPLLDGPNVYRIDVSDQTALPFAVVLAGGTRLAAPLPWGCALHTDFFGTLPLLPDATGTSRVFVQLPFGTHTLQAATFGFSTIHMSDGIEFVCM